MKTTLAERPREARKAASMTQKILGDVVRVSQAAIQKARTGRAAQTIKLLGIAKALRVRPEWLSSGIGAMRADGEDDEKPSHMSHDVFRVDILDLAVSTGPGIMNQEFMEILHSVECALTEARHMFNGRKAENIRIINVRGDSMSGMTEPGGLLFAGISVKSFDDDGIYAFPYGDTAHVKRLQKMKDKLLVISDNKSYTAWDPIEKDEINRVFVFDKVIGNVPQTYRKHG